MALTEEQKRIVRESISHLLDFSTNQATFTAQMRDLMTALTVGATEENDYYWIGETLRNPTNYLKAVSQTGSDTTVGEVQKYLIDYLTETINTIALNHSPFEPATVLKLIGKAAFETTFTATKTRVESGESIWDLSPLPDHIFTRRLCFVEEALPDLPGDDVEDWQSTDEDHSDVVEYDYQKPTMIVLEVCVTTNNQQKTIRRELEPLRTRFNTDEEEANYIARIKRRAELDGLHFAATVALQQFTNAQVRSKVVKLINYNRPAEMLLTHRYYFSCLEKAKLKLSTIAKVNTQEAVNLLDPSIVNLLDKKILTFSVAKSLRPAVATLVRHPIYHPLLLQKILNIKTAQTLSDERCHFLIDPRIANLIQRNKLPVTEAISLPLFLHQLITHNGYIHYFESAVTDWQKVAIVRERLCGVLLHPQINYCIVNQHLPLAEAAKILSEALPQDVALLQLHALILANRCMRFIRGNPCLLQNELDSPAAIQQTVGEFTYTLRCDATSLHNITVNYLTYMFKEFLTSQLKELVKANQKVSDYHHLLAALQTKQPEHNLDEFIQAIGEMQKRLRKESYLNEENSPLLPSKCDNTLFHSKKKRQRADVSNEELSRFCDGVMKLSPLLATPTQYRFGCQIL